MPYNPTTWVDNVTLGNATRMNNLETQYTQAINSLSLDMAPNGFVFTGLNAAKDAVIANQLNVATGIAYVAQLDGTRYRIVPNASTQTTSALSSTYYLFLNSDGTWTWGTSSSGPVNALPICQATTDGSGNISAVTDRRVTAIALLTGGSVSIELPSPLALQQTQNGHRAGNVYGGVTFGVAGALKGSYDTAATFNGTTGYISVPNAALPTGANAAFSMECWAKFAAAPAATQFVMEAGDRGSATHQIGIVILNTGAAQLSNGTTNINSGVLSTGVYHHLVGTFDGTNMHFYVDGVQIGTGSAASLTLSYVGAVPACIGANSTGTGFAAPVSFFAGQIDEAAFYTAALSGTQITNHYNAGISTTADGYQSMILGDSPAYYYRLGDAVGSTLAADTMVAASTTIVDAGTTIKTVGGATTAGGYGVSTVIGAQKDLNVASTTATTIASATAPGSASALVRCTLTFYIGSANTNNGTCTATVAYTDAITGATTATFVPYGSTTAISGSVITKGTRTRCADMPLEVAGGSTISVKYQNGAAGTISDYASATIEVLA